MPAIKDYRTVRARVTVAPNRPGAGPASFLAPLAAETAETLLSIALAHGAKLVSWVPENGNLGSREIAVR
jgi:hypothetical protein